MSRLDNPNREFAAAIVEYAQSADLPTLALAIKEKNNFFKQAPDVFRIELFKRLFDIRPDSLTLPPDFRKQLNVIHKNLAKSDLEHLYVGNLSGVNFKLMEKAVGSEHKVDITPEMLSACDCVLHNHPSGLPPSTLDVVMFAVEKSASIGLSIITLPDETEYLLVRAKKEQWSFAHRMAQDSIDDNLEMIFETSTPTLEHIRRKLERPAIRNRVEHVVLRTAKFAESLGVAMYVGKTGQSEFQRIREGLDD